MFRIAIQNKGRLNEESMDLLQQIGICVDRRSRKYLSSALNYPVEILYLRDDDIPQVVAGGSTQLGIVGLNVLRELNADVDIVANLGFGACRLSLAIPKSVQYTGLQYFQGKRIATSYPSILKDYLEQNGIQSEILTINGSVEITPQAGMADAIFDIVSSGGTLVANGLKEVERVLESEAVLVANRNLSADECDILDELLFRIRSVEVSRDKKYLLMNIPTDRVEEAIRILPAMRSPTVLPLIAEGWSSLHSVVDTSRLWEKVKQLKEIGAEGILVLSVDKIIP